MWVKNAGKKEGAAEWTTALHQLGQLGGAWCWNGSTVAARRLHCIRCSFGTFHELVHVTVQGLDACAHLVDARGDARRHGVDFLLLHRSNRRNSKDAWTMARPNRCRGNEDGSFPTTARVKTANAHTMHRSATVEDTEDHGSEASFSSIDERERDSRTRTNSCSNFPACYARRVRTVAILCRSACGDSSTPTHASASTHLSKHRFGIVRRSLSAFDPLLRFVHVLLLLLASFHGESSVSRRPASACLRLVFVAVDSTMTRVFGFVPAKVNLDEPVH